MRKTKKLILASTLCIFSFLATNGFTKQVVEIVHIARFSMMDLDGWKSKSFEGETQYTISNDEKKYYLKAESMQSASALYKKIKVNIHETPYLNWSWRIDQALPKLNEKEKFGDDYAARIYVVFKTGFTPLSTKALNYIWSSNNDGSSYWPNAYTEKAIMIPIRTNQDKTHDWKHEKVNIEVDLMKHFTTVPKYIDGVAIMTDSDNSKGNASASYGDIYFSRN
ncbi:MAG: DUF3047 domain-containing protein [Gammaproteobacteria bacterium]